MLLFLVGVFLIERKIISSAPLFDPASESDPEGTLEKRVRDEYLEAEAETGTGDETGVWERLTCCR